MAGRNDEGQAEKPQKPKTVPRRECDSLSKMVFSDDKSTIQDARQIEIDV